MSDATGVEALTSPVWARLNTLTAVNCYDGEFVDAEGNQAPPPVDQDGRVHAYAVFYPSPGWDHALLNDGLGDSLDWTFQVTCAGGDRTRALWCVNQVRGRLSGWRIPLAGQELVVHEVGDPGPLRRDDTVKPARFWAPLIFRVFA